MQGLRSGSLPPRACLVQTDFKENVKYPLGSSESAEEWHAQNKLLLSVFGHMCWRPANTRPSLLAGFRGAGSRCASRHDAYQHCGFHRQTPPCCGLVPSQADDFCCRLWTTLLAQGEFGALSLQPPKAPGQMLWAVQPVDPRIYPDKRHSWLRICLLRFCKDPST